MRAESLEVCYGESVVLRDISIEVNPGEVVCLIGRNGVGKTTLLKTLMGLMHPRRGKVVWKGQELGRRPPEYRARRGIGYVPQGREIFPHLTVVENLHLGLEVRRDRLKTIPADIYELFPALYGIGERKGGALSGGQQQQLSIARALLGEPSLLLLDEPREGIQPSIVLEIERGIEKIKATKLTAILLVEQSVEFAIDVADRYYVLDKGEMVAHGPTIGVNPEVLLSYIAV